jgi:hypothetical protein
MAVHVTSSVEKGVEAKFTIQAVFDPIRLSGTKRGQYILISDMLCTLTAIN